MAVTTNDVNTKKTFRKTALIDKPVQTFKDSPKISPNPYVGTPQKNAAARKHHLVEDGPDSVLEATQTATP